jgi:hypothetical protein
MRTSRFDHFTRQLVGRSRRDMLRAGVVALVARTLAPPRAAFAHLDGVVTLGGACTADLECRQEDARAFPAAVTCGDNGFSEDGELTCCAGRSACCTSDADCCGSLRCAVGGEICGLCSPPPFPTRYYHQVCTSHAECLFNYACGKTACINQRCECIKPNDITQSQSVLAIPDPDAAMMVAELLSRLEVAGDSKSLDTLYRVLHPDAQDVIPQEAVVGWFENEFPYFGEPPAVAIKVRYVPWTWEVTGKTYPDAAQVAMRHYLSDGTTRRVTVPLVKDQYGTWGWFFGRDRAFVEAQIERYQPQGALPLS